MILLIDNYDSFSYNLYQMIGEIEPDVKVVRNDEISVDERCRDTHRSCKRTWERNSNPRCLPGTSGSLRGLWSENYLCKKANARKAVSDKSRYRNVVVFRLLTEHFGCKISFSCGRRRHDSGQSLCYRLHKRRRNHGDTA